MAIDPTDLRLEAAPHSRDVKLKPPRHQQGEPFLMGPIPWAWLQRAAECSGKALHVAVYLWWLAGMTNSAEVKVSTTSLEKELGVKRHSAGRALRCLAAARLIKYKPCCGRKPRITICNSHAER